MTGCRHPNLHGVRTMSHLTKQDRFHILELAAEIAAEAAQNPSVVWMIEFQEQLVESLYRKMTAMVESDLDEGEVDDEEEGDDDEIEAVDEDEADAQAIELDEAIPNLAPETTKKKVKAKKRKKAA
jgi:Mn-containing catalase